jgi:hypothetical protein
MLPLFLAAALGAAPPAHSPLTIVPGADPREVRVVAVLPAAAAKELPSGLLKQDQGEQVLTFARLDSGSGKPGVAMFGRYEHVEGKLVFTPRHPLLGGQRYRATLIGKKDVTADYLAPKKKIVGAPTVEKIYPTSGALPANLLKFYVHFSRPMRETKTIFDHIHLIDDKGKPVHDPWRRAELWSRDGKRLTLLIHPGRIKRGVNLNEEIGPVLEPDRTYTLRIEGKVEDVDGVALGKTYEKKFKTTKAVRSFVLVEDWDLTAPKLGTREPMTLSFPRPLDHALLHSLVTVVDGNKKPVAGTMVVGKDEKSWAFTPAAAWGDQDYRVVVDPDLEDLAGNTPEQLFDVDNTAPKTPPKPQTLKFRPGKK